MTEQARFNEILKRMSKIYLRIIIPGIGLKYKHENVLYLYYVEEKSIAEIADELKMTRESTANLLCKARKELRAMIKRHKILMSDELQQCLSLFDDEIIE